MHFTSAYRKIEQTSWSKFSLGYSEKQDMVTVPVHSPDGMPVGFVGRSIEGKEFKNIWQKAQNERVDSIAR